jgi:2-dehydropantoate 2-reductase
VTLRLSSLQRALSHWGSVDVTDNIWGYLWGKQAYGAMLFATALTNDSMADAIDAHRPLMIALAGEVLSVAAALGIAPLGFDGFDPSAVSECLDDVISIRRKDEKTHSGVWRDLAIRKRPTEVDAHFLPIVDYATAFSLEVPLLKRMIAMIHEVESGDRDFADLNLVELAQAQSPRPCS